MSTITATLVSGQTAVVGVASSREAYEIEVSSGVAGATGVGIVGANVIAGMLNLTLSNSAVVNAGSVMASANTGTITFTGNTIGQFNNNSINVVTNGKEWTFGMDGLFSIPGGIYANGSTGSNGQVLTSTGTSVRWTTPVVANTQTDQLTSNGYTVVLGTNGNLTLPQTGKVSVVGVDPTDIADLETTYNDNEAMYQDALTSWRTSTSFTPIWFKLSGRLAYDEIIAWTLPNGISPLPSNLIPLAYACKISYNAWQEAIVSSKLSIKTDTASWEFDSTGRMTLPQGGSIAGGNMAAIEAAYTAWQQEQADWLYVITTGGADTNIRPWHFAGPSPEERMDVLIAMWQAQQTSQTINWVAISTAHYNEVRAWLSLTASSDGYRLWKKLTTGVNVTSDAKTWSFTYDGSVTFPDSTVQTTAFTGAANNASYLGGVAAGQYAFANQISNTGNVTFTNTTLGTSVVNSSIIIQTRNNNPSASPAINSASSWTFGYDGTLAFPDTSVYGGSSITVPAGSTNKFSWNFSDVAIGSDTVSLQWNLLETTLDQWYLSTSTSSKYWLFDSTTQQLSYTSNPGIDGGGRLTMGTAANGGAGAVNDIELTSSNSTVYIRSSNNVWSFGSNGAATFPDSTIQTTAFTGNSNNALYLGGVAAASYLVTNTDIATGNLSVTGNITLTGNLSGNTAGFEIGYKDVPQNYTNTSFTIALSDRGKHIYTANGTAQTITIANNASVAFPIGTAITVVSQGAGTITVARGAGVSLYLAANNTSADRTVSTYGMATLLKVNTDTWFISGAGVA